ncbi:MAG TPA: hypothetical protein DDX92_00695 [Flavobacteriales bacterium]|jgi:LEA14-like dessication related protein|nr:hypothetical protein [Flavobacteriales bacterium]
MLRYFLKPALFAIAFALMSLTISSCNYHEIEVVEISNVEISDPRDQSVKGKIFLLSLVLNNPNSAAIQLRDGELDLSINEEKFGTLTLMDNAVLPSGNNQKVDINMLFQMEEDVQIQWGDLLVNTLNKGTVDIVISGHAKGKWGIWPRKIQIQERIELPLNQLMQELVNS